MSCLSPEIATGSQSPTRPALGVDTSAPPGKGWTDRPTRPNAANHKDADFQGADQGGHRAPQKGLSLGLHFMGFVASGR